MIKLKNIRKSFNHIEILKGVSICINDGEFVSIIGKSGSGKTTLLKIIGLIENFDGEYIFNGKNVDGKKDNVIIRRDNFGYIYQSYFLDLNYTVYENIEIPLLIRNIKKGERKRRIVEISNYLGIESLLKKKAKCLSGGEQQRVAIARALVTDANVILADEPCGALDSENSNIIMNLLKKLNSDGKTIILVTHDMDQANMADKVYHLKDGEFDD